MFLWYVSAIFHEMVVSQPVSTQMMSPDYHWCEVTLMGNRNVISWSSAQGRTGLWQL